MVSSQSHRTAQGNSEDAGLHRVGGLELRRNPTVQLRAIPRALSQRPRGHLRRDVAIPPYSSGQFRGTPSQRPESTRVKVPVFPTSSERRLFSPAALRFCLPERELTF